MIIRRRARFIIHSDDENEIESQNGQHSQHEFDYSQHNNQAVEETYTTQVPVGPPGIG
jgi:hypothetical protein